MLLESTSIRLSSVRARDCAALAVLVAALAPRPSAADDAADERKLAARSTLTQFAAANTAAKEHGFFDGFEPAAASCRAAIKDGTAAGLKATDTFDTEAGLVLWKNAAGVCDEYARLAPMKAAVDAVARDYGTVVIVRGDDGHGIDHMSGDAYRVNVEVAKRCVRLVDEAVKAGAPADVGFAPDHNLNDTLVTLAEVRAQCNDFIGGGAKLAAADDAVQAAAQAALRAKYAKLGITGDRLKYLMDSDTHIYVMGKGCKTLSMAGKKSAPVIYEMQEGDTYWVVYKMTFKGDTLVKQTEKRFNKATSRGWSCK